VIDRWSGSRLVVLVARRRFNVVVAALANKLARIIWAMLGRDEAYRATAYNRSLR
jgi:hypothetical protein